jgi:hypothetical protein
VEALVVGTNDYLIWPLPYLLARAGFEVDTVEVSGLLRHSRFVRQAHRVSHIKFIAGFTAGLIRERAKAYDLVVVADDPTLTAFVEWERRSGHPCESLPVIDGQSRDHLHSKIGLSKTFSESGVRTPPFEIAASRDDAIAVAERLGYPVFVKTDAGSGGRGVHKCRDRGEIAGLPDVFAQPVLVQKSVEGPEHRVTAAFFDSQLVHFDYSVVEKSYAHFGPSILRTYYPSALVDGIVFDELAALGRALGAHGFANISCIDAADGSGRYYFEADMRPNGWVDVASHYGEDPAKRIRNWFVHRTVLTRDDAVAASTIRAPLRIPHFLRLSFLELAINRYGVWRYLPRADARLTRALLLGKVHDLFYSTGARDLVPAPVRTGIKRTYKAVRALAR